MLTMQKRNTGSTANQMFCTINPADGTQTQNTVIIQMTARVIKIVVSAEAVSEKSNRIHGSDFTFSS